MLLNTTVLTLAWGPAENLRGEGASQKQAPHKDKKGPRKDKKTHKDIKDSLHGGKSLPPPIRRKKAATRPPHGEQDLAKGDTCSKSPPPPHISIK